MADWHYYNKKVKDMHRKYKSKERSLQLQKIKEMTDGIEWCKIKISLCLRIA